MIELIGIIFGGASRLAQYWLELRDRDREREHEARMLAHQIELADKRHVHDVELRQMDAAAADASAEWAAMTAAIEAQARESQAAGGRVAKFSALQRPLLTFWHAILIYTLVKVAGFWIAVDLGVDWRSVIEQLHTPFDRALVGSIVSYWFADRSLRRMTGGPR